MTTVSTEPDREPSRLHGARARWLWAWAVTSMLIAVLAFAVGTRIRSPWDEAIENARTPEVTAYVVEQSVSLPVPEIAGTVHLGTLVPVLPPAELEHSVVTGVVTGAGQTLLPGAVLAEV